MRAYNGADSRWYQSAIKQQGGQIHAAWDGKGGIFESVHDADLHTQIDAAYQHRYKTSPYLFHMTGSTLKLLLLKSVRHNMQDILTRDREGDIISLDDPDYSVILKIIHKAIRLTSKCPAHRDYRGFVCPV